MSRYTIQNNRCNYPGKRFLAKICFALVIIFTAFSILFSADLFLNSNFISVMILLLVLVTYSTVLFIFTTDEKKQRLIALTIISLLILIGIFSFLIRQHLLGFYLILFIAPLPLLIALAAVFRQTNISFWGEISLAFILVQLTLFLSIVQEFLVVQLIPLFTLIALLVWRGSNGEKQISRATLLLIGAINLGLFVYLFRQESGSKFIGLIPDILLITLFLLSFYKIFTTSLSWWFLSLIWSGLLFLQIVSHYIPPGSGSLMLIGWPIFVLINTLLIVLIARNSPDDKQQISQRV